MASRAQKIVDDLNTTITNLGFERFDPPVLLAPTTVQDDFNLALGRPLVTENHDFVPVVVPVAEVVPVPEVVAVPVALPEVVVEPEVVHVPVEQAVVSHDFVPVAEVVHVPEVVDALQVVHVPVEQALVELEEGMTVNIFYKTRMCDDWRASGYCSHGLRCHFAHGQAQLRTRLCKNFRNPNGCSFGDRCKYRHQP